MKKLLLGLITILGLIGMSYGQAKKAKPGYYYGKDGNKIEGEFVFKIPNPSSMTGAGKLIEYRDGKKVETFKESDIDGFVLEGDSFAVVTFESGAMGMSITIQDFAKIQSEGEITFAAMYYTTGSSRVEYIKEDFDNKKKMMKLGIGAGLTVPFLYRKGSTSEFTEHGYPLNKSKEKLVATISDYKALADEVSSMKKMKVYTGFADIIERYNKWYANQNK